MTFGGTKNGMLGGEAVVFLDPAIGARGQYVRKTVTQLPSKMRFVAAQFNALLDGDLWLELAGHSNRMATALHTATGGLPASTPGRRRRSTACSRHSPPPAIGQLQAWTFFWDWDRSRHQVRWMTAWDTTVDDIETFATGVGEIVASD